MYSLETLKNIWAFESAIFRGLAKAQWMSQPIDRLKDLSEERITTGYVKHAPKIKEITSYNHPSAKDSGHLQKLYKSLDFLKKIRDK